MTFSIMTFSIMTFGIMTFNIMTLSILTFSITMLGIIVKNVALCLTSLQFLVSQFSYYATCRVCRMSLRCVVAPFKSLNAKINQGLVL